MRRRESPRPPAASPPKGPAERAGRRRASIGWALRSGFRDIYDYLGAWVAASLVWSGTATLGGVAIGRISAWLSVSSGAPIWLPALILGLAFVAIILGPLTGGLYHYARNAAARDEPELADFVWGFRSAWGRCARLALAQAVIGGLLGGDVMFFLTMRRPLFAVLAIVMLYLWAFWILATMYQWPLLAHEEGRVRRVIRKSLLLTLDNLLFSVAIGGVCLLLTLVLGALVAGALILWAGSLAMLRTQATRELLRRYELLGADPTRDLPPEALTE